MHIVVKHVIVNISKVYFCSSMLETILNAILFTDSSNLCCELYKERIHVCFYYAVNTERQFEC